MAFIIYPDDNSIDRTKFETCRFRSVEKQTIQIKNCCKTTYEEGYICYKIPIDGVTPFQCLACNSYEPN